MGCSARTARARPALTTRPAGSGRAPARQLPSPPLRLSPPAHRPTSSRHSPTSAGGAPSRTTGRPLPPTARCRQPRCWPPLALMARSRRRARVDLRTPAGGARRAPRGHHGETRGRPGRPPPPPRRYPPTARSRGDLLPSPSDPRRRGLVAHHGRPWPHPGRIPRDQLRAAGVALEYARAPRRRAGHASDPDDVGG